MASYSYVAIMANGKEKKGSMEAPTPENVTMQLKADGLIPISVTEQSFLTKDINISFKKKVKPRELSLFCRQILGIISAGVNIMDALGIVAEQTENAHLKEAILTTQTSVEKGDGLASSMRIQGPEIFPSLFINMVEAGEASGSLELAFDRMATHFEKEAKLKAMIKKAMIYPCIVGGVSLAVILVMMLVVVPNFESLFSQMNSDLPPITRFMRDTSAFLTHHIVGIIIVISLIGVGLHMYKNSPKGKMQFAKLALSIPIFGKLNLKSYCSRYARTISTLLVAGIPLIDAIEITAKTIDNIIIKNALLEARDEVVRGVPLSIPLKASGVFPPMVSHMTRIGEETGNIEGMLTKLADYYDEEVDMATQSLSAVLEPVIILVLAAIVCLLIASIMSPILKMYQDLDQLG